MLAILLLVGAGLYAWGGGRGATRPTGETRPPARSTVATPARHLSVRPLPQLPAAVSREVVLPGARGLEVLGGLDAGQGSVGGIFALDPSRGTVQSQASLPRPAHDAAGAVVHGAYFVFGGGASTTVATVQEYRPGQAARVAGELPAPRSDLVAAAVGGTVYLAGGYDGRTLAADVLATSDGTTFRVAGELAVPVRYPAVAVARSALYLVGGRAAGGETSVVQRFDPTTGATRVVAHLPEPLAEAAAWTLDGRVFVAGGRTPSGISDRVYEIDPVSGTTTRAATLPLAVRDAAVVVARGTAYLVGGETPAPSAEVTALRLEAGGAPSPASTVGVSWKQGEPAFTGHLLVADRGNDRLLVVDAAKRILWTYPSPGAPPPPGGFYFPDDAFFARHGTSIISNQEENDSIVRIAYPSGRVLWRYGRAKVAGSAPGFLDQPDDAFLLADGTVTVADAKNCRVLLISPSGVPSGQIGTTGQCVHDPPRRLGYPNGDTPLPDGNLLVSEIDGSWIDEITTTGKLVWSVHLPLAYPSDPQQLGPDLYLVADYTKPGGIVEFTREGRIVWQYRPPSGPGMLDHPSLAERLPNGLIAVNDDYRHRVALVDPSTSAIVWQYGRTDQPGTGPGSLDTPDGFDLLRSNGTTPTHPTTG